jgi:hypothetical protein
MFLPNLTGITGLTLLLRKSSDYSAVNGAGDALSESGSTGWFTAEVAEPWTQELSAAVIDSDGLIPAGGWLGVGETIISDSRGQLTSRTMAKVNRVEAVVSGTATGAGTDTEVFVGPDATVTVTVDSDGNRSNVEIS